MTASLFSIETGSGEVDTPLKIWGDLNVRCPLSLSRAFNVISIDSHHNFSSVPKNSQKAQTTI